MKSKAYFYHAGCPVCVEAERKVASAIDTNRFDLEVIHLGEDKIQIKQAETAGVKSVPAIVLDGVAFHINYGAAINDLK